MKNEKFLILRTVEVLSQSGRKDYSPQRTRRTRRKSILKLRVLGKCSCIALPPASLQSSVSSVVSLLNRILSQSGRVRIAYQFSGSNIKKVRDAYPTVFFVYHEDTKNVKFLSLLFFVFFVSRQLLLHCSTSCIRAVVRGEIISLYC